MSHPADLDEYWYQQRLEDARFAERVRHGQCGNCGAYDGPDHRCPPAPVDDAS